jgi:hypothetical protein
MTEYSINPCKAAQYKQKLQFIGGGINDLNSACFDTCAAFGENWKRNSQCNKQCNDFISMLRHKKSGNFCYPKFPYKAVAWNNSAHYFPELFWEYKDVEKAKNKCIDVCDNERYNQKTCRLNCLVDAKAVVLNDKREHFIQTHDNNNILDKHSTDKKVTFQDYSNSSPFAFYFGFGIVGLITIVVVCLILKSLFEIR